MLKELKSKVKLQAFSNRTGIDEEYLVLLKREAGSYIPKTVKLDKFPEADQALLQRLHEIGIADSKKLVNQFYNDEKPVRAVYSDFKKSFQYLVELCDLSRIPGVGPAFAYILWRSGNASAEDFLNTPITEVFETSCVFYNELFPKGPVYRIGDLEYAYELSRFMKVQIPIKN